MLINKDKLIRQIYICYKLQRETTPILVEIDVQRDAREARKKKEEYLFFLLLFSISPFHIIVK